MQGRERARGLEAYLVEIKEYVRAYKERWGEPVALHIVNRRFGVRFKQAFGRTIREFIAGRPDVFVCSVAKTGGLLVDLRVVHPLEWLVVETLRGGSLTLPALMTALSGSGYTAGDLMEISMQMQQAGLLRLEDGVYSLNERREV